MRIRALMILAAAAWLAGPAWSQVGPLPPVGPASLGPLSTGHAAGLLLARQAEVGGLLLTGAGGVVAAGVALSMSGDGAGIRPDGQGQSAVINSTIGTAP